MKPKSVPDEANAYMLKQFIPYLRGIAAKIRNGARANQGAEVEARYVLTTGALISITVKAANLGLSLLTIPISIKYFGNERYGLWMLALSTLSLTSFLDIGITPTIKNKLAEAFARKDETAFRYYSSCAVLIGGLITIVGLVLSLFALFVDWSALFNAEGTIPKSEVTALVSVLLGVLMASLGSGMVETIFASRLQIAKAKMNQLASLLIGFLLFWSSISIGASLPVVAAMMPSSLLAGRVVLLFELVKQKRLTQVQGPSQVASLIGSLLPSSFLFLGIQASAAVFTAAPNFLIARWSSLSDVAAFSVAYKLVTIPLLLTAEALPVVWPAFTIAWAQRDTAWIRKRLWTALRTTTFGFVICGALFVLAGEHVIARWTSNRIQVTQSLLVMLCLWLVVQGIVYWLSTFLHSITDFFFEFAAYIATTSLFILFSFLTVSLMGLSGIAFSMFAAVLVGSMIPMALRVRSRLA